MRSFFSILCIIVILLFSGTTVVSGLEENRDQQFLSTEEGDERIQASFFYSLTCAHCNRVRPHIEELGRVYPCIDVDYREIAHSRTNRDYFFAISESYQIENPLIPLFVIGGAVMIGEEQTNSGLRRLLEAAETEPVTEGDTDRRDLVLRVINSFHDGTAVYRGNALPSSVPETIPPGGKPSPATQVTVAAVLIGAAVDSINPCAFAVLFVLLAYLSSLNDRRRMLQVGLVYIGTVFMVYLLAGLALLGFVHSLDISSPFFSLAAIIVILAGLIQIGEVLRQNHVFSLSIPEQFKERIGSYIRRATIPSAFLLGALVSIVELPCTGGIYLAILALLADRMSMMQGLPYLILYNLIFVLPLLLVLAIVYRGSASGQMDTWRQKYNRPVRLGMGVCMIVIGMMMLAGIV